MSIKTLGVGDGAISLPNVSRRWATGCPKASSNSFDRTNQCKKLLLNVGIPIQEDTIMPKKETAGSFLKRSPLYYCNSINHLRIHYVMTELILNQNSVLRKYSIDSLARHAGYNNSIAFARAFQNHTGVKPSAFIKELLTKESA